MTDKLDPVTLEVIRSALPAIATEMAADLHRTSYNMMIYEVRDFCTAMLTTDARLVSQNVGGVSHFVADLGAIIDDGMKRYGAAGFKPDDVVITNHQAVAGQHLNNVVIYMPYFFRGELLMFSIVRAHWIDVGGISTGFGGGAEVVDPWMEGLQLDQLKIYEAGKLRQQWIFSHGGAERTYYLGTAAGAVEVMKTFIPAGVHHILIGPDHLLFLFGLLLLGGTWKSLVKIVTAFTLGHSLTLSLATLGVFSPPAAIVEPGIALTIVVVGADNLMRGGGRDLRPWAARVFGLVHGFGFASVLREFGLPKEALGWSLFSFNVGIECGQLLVLALMLPALVLFRRVVPERAGVIVLSAFATHTAWHWMTERWDALRQAPWPQLDATAVTVLARWAAASLLAAGAAHMLAKWADGRRPPHIELPEAALEQVTNAGPEQAA